MRTLCPIPAAQTYAQVLELFQDKTRWLQGYYQVDRDGNKCPWKEGYSFCVLGAICYFTDGMTHKAQCLLQRVSEHLYNESIQMVNDSQDGYDKVIVALKLAQDIWKDREPTDDELGMPISNLMEKRKNEMSAMSK